MRQTKRLYFTWSLHDYDVKKEGIRIGRREGIKANKIESARKLLTMKLLTHEQISEAVGLPLEKIEEFAAEITAAK